MKKINMAVEHNIESIARSRGLIDNGELISRAWYQTSQDLKLSSWTYTKGTHFVRETVSDMCHRGILVLFYKRTKKERLSLIVCHHQRLQSVLESISSYLVSMKGGVRLKQVSDFDRRILDILVYLGEADLVGESVIPVVKALEGHRR